MFHLYSYLFIAIGFQQFLDQDSEITLEMIEEGKEHLKREKRRVQRMNEAGQRRGYTSQRESSQQPQLHQDDLPESRARAPIFRDTNFTSAAVASPERSQSLLDVESGPPEMIHDSLENPRYEAPRNLFDDL